MSPTTYPVPAHFDQQAVDKVWKVDYQARATDARAWAKEHNILPASEDRDRVGLVLIDVQNTFCIPGFELFVAGPSGMGAVDDNKRLCEFIYRNLGNITEITYTLDTHQAAQIFHALFLVNDAGEHPEPYTLISAEDIHGGKWKFNPSVAPSLGIEANAGQEHLEYYVDQLTEASRYDLTIWPYHAMLGGIGHALVPAVEEAVFFHSMVRMSQADSILKGFQPLTEHYSGIGPEVLVDARGQELGIKDTRLVDKVKSYDAVIIAGQAKSHCVASTINDLLIQINEQDEQLAKKIYLLEDCTSPVVIPGAVDYSEEADAAYQRFAEAGMHIIQSSESVEQWLGDSS